jgi:hypothetical protein
MKLKAALLFGVFLLAGCLPVPTIPHGLGVVLDKKDLESLRPGEVTRADVLLRLGEPSYRLEEDRFFMYEWTLAYGYVFIGGGYQAAGFPVTAPHYLCLEFGTDSNLLRREQITGSLYSKPDKAIQRCCHQKESK